MKISLQDAKELVFGDAPEGYLIIEESKWVHSHPKLEEMTVIFQFGNRYYEISNTRSGSPFSDWWYESNDWKGEQEVTEVKKVEKLTYEWVNV